MKYPFRHLRNKEVGELIEEAIWRKKINALPNNELHSADIRVNICSDGEMQVWRLESYKR